MNSDQAAALAFMVLALCAIVGTLVFIDSLEVQEAMTRDYLASKKGKVEEK